MEFFGVMYENAWALYALVLLAPFVQEDAAVVGAAAASAAGAGDTAALFAAILLGLTLSDTWKYGAGRFARSHAWARRFSEKPGVAQARSRVVERLGASLMAVRFVPGTRIPFYVACGLFAAPFGKFMLFLLLSGLAYVALAFGMFHAIGEAAGEDVRGWTPWVALSLVALLLGWQGVRAWRRRAAISG